MDYNFTNYDRFIPGLSLYVAFYESALEKLKVEVENFCRVREASGKRALIKSISGRIKEINSLDEKLTRKGIEKNLNSVIENITDIAGMRIICEYIDDVETVEEKLNRIPGFVVKERIDYIYTPKKSGYRSLHLVLQTYIWTEEGNFEIPIEVQIRTSLQDVWASKEHSLRYKNGNYAQNDNTNKALLELSNRYCDQDWADVETRKAILGE